MHSIYWKSHCIVLGVAHASIGEAIKERIRLEYL